MNYCHVCEKVPHPKYTEKYKKYKYCSLKCYDEHLAHRKLNVCFHCRRYTLKASKMIKYNGDLFCHNECANKFKHEAELIVAKNTAEEIAKLNQQMEKLTQVFNLLADKCQLNEKILIDK